MPLNLFFYPTNNQNPEYILFTTTQDKQTAANTHTDKVEPSNVWHSFFSTNLLHLTNSILLPEILGSDQWKSFLLPGTAPPQLKEGE